MDESKPPPLVFANQVIKLFADHLLGDMRVDPSGFQLIRIVFRKLGGSWFELCQGSPRHTNLLIESVKAWGARNSQDQ